MNVLEIQKRIIPIMRKYDIKEAYLYGSYARGEATDGSDINLRLVCDSVTYPKITGWNYGGLHTDLNEALGKRVTSLLDREDTGLKNIPIIESFPDYVNRMEQEQIKVYERKCNDKT